MTYCLGIKLKDGLISISDTRISSGTNITVKKKVYTHQNDSSSLFIMTSGLRSVRDKVLFYFEELLEEGEGFNKLNKAVNAFGEQIKRVSLEDRPALELSGLKFNINTIIGGQMKDDDEHKLFLLYSEGNWVEIESDSPYVIIGNSAQGKSILNNVIDDSTTMQQALKAGFVSFDSTRTSGNDVEFPIDVILYKKNSFQMVEQRFEAKELNHISVLWQKKLKNSLDELPNEWMQEVLNKFENDNPKNN